MFMIFEPNINVDEELSALLADFDAFAGADTPLLTDTLLVDPTPVLNPMIGDDGVVFGDPPAPAVSDADVPSSLADVSPPATAPDDAAVADAAVTDLIAGFDLAALPQGDEFGIDLDALILAVGRNLESFSFNLFQ